VIKNREVLAVCVAITNKIIKYDTAEERELTSVKSLLDELIFSANKDFDRELLDF